MPHIGRARDGQTAVGRAKGQRASEHKSVTTKEILIVLGGTGSRKSPGGDMHAG